MISIKQTIALSCIALAGMSANLSAGEHNAHGLDKANKTKLKTVLAAQDDSTKARYGSRHPLETLSFFGIEAGMSVVEVLPGGGWYTQLLAPYLGDEGSIYGVNYADNMWPMFGFFSEERIKKRIAATAEFPAMVEGFAGKGITAQGFAFGDVPASAKGKADAVLFIRAMHNINRFADKGVRDQALSDVYDMLKPGGIVGLVQHRAPESATDKWADGSAGYLNHAAVISTFEKAGFKLVASSEMNANALDKPVEGDVVWRLPPSLSGKKDKSAEELAALKAIGESDRMTLRFQKVDK
jgi:predicted methyltransferase